MMDKLLKLIHIVGVVIFLGNIITTLVWKIYAEKSRDAKIISHNLRLALATDKLLTIPGVLITTISGILLVLNIGLEILSNYWLTLSILIWIGSSIVAIFYLVPSLKRLSDLADALAREGEMSNEYFIKTKHWNLISLLLILSPLIILALMIYKP